MSLNLVVLQGNLTRDVELKVGKSDTVIAKVGLAVNTGYGEKKLTAFIDCTAFGKTAEFLEKNFKKGAQVLITGRLSQSSWEDKDTGNKRTKLEVIINDVNFTGGKLHPVTSEDSGEDNPF